MSHVSHIDEAHCWNISRIAEAFAMDRGTVRKRLAAAGVQPAHRRGNTQFYRLADAGPALFLASGNTPDNSTHDPSVMPPKDRKEWFQSENERLKFEQNTGQLIPAPNVRGDYVRTLKAVVGFFESMTDKMERTRLFNAEQLEQLERTSDEFRAQLYEQLMELDDDA